MYYYFSCEYPSVIKINGIYYGTIYECVKSINYTDENPLFVEVCSLTNAESSVNMLLNDEFLSCPYQNTVVSDLKGGFFIKIKAQHKKDGFSILTQEKSSTAVITVFNENGLKISIETPEDFYAEDIKFNADNAVITPFYIDNAQLIAIALSGQKTLLCVFKIDKKITRLFFRQVDEYDVSNGLSTTEKFNDIAKHTLQITWGLDCSELKEKNRKVSHAQTFSLTNLHEKIIPYAFLEQLLVGGNLDDYLCDNIKENSNMLGDYFGSFIGVCPPPAFYDKDCVGVIYREKENVYKLEYFAFDIQNRKISNINKL